MDVISAIKSGKRFKYKALERWFEPVDLSRGTLKRLDVPVTWLVNDGWEVEEKEPVVTISRTEFFSRIRPMVKDSVQMEEIAQELGLG